MSTSEHKISLSHNVVCSAIHAKSDFYNTWRLHCISLNRFRNQPADMFAEILIVKHLHVSCPTSFLESKFPGVSHIVRYGDDVAYLCFDDLAIATRYRCTHAFFKYPKTKKNERGIVHTHMRQATLERCQGRSMKRINMVHDIRAYNESVSYTPTCFLEIAATHYLTIAEWQDICPEAYDIIKTEDDNRVIVHCRDRLDAHRIYQRVNYDRYSFVIEERERLFELAAQFINTSRVFSHHRFEKAVCELRTREEYGQVVLQVVSAVLEDN